MIVFLGVTEASITNETVPPIVHSDQLKMLPYPRRVFLIIGNEFCERFCFGTMKGKEKPLKRDSQSY